MVESSSSQKGASGLKVVVFGATGGTGIELCKQAVEAGHHVTAYVRNPEKLILESPNLIKVKAELNDTVAMENAIKDKDAVLSSLGGKGLLSRDTTCSVGTKAIISAMKKEGVARIIVLSSYGVGPNNRSLLPWAVRGMLYHPLADKDEQEADILASGLDYTIVRPPRLKDEPARGDYLELDQGKLPGTEISRADVASFMLKCASEKTWIQKIAHICWKPAPK